MQMSISGPDAYKAWLLISSLAAVLGSFILWGLTVCCCGRHKTKLAKCLECIAAFCAVLQAFGTGLGWLIIIWGGLIQGSLFRLLDDRDFWLVFAVWMSENLTKYIYMYPEGNFYKQRGTRALKTAAETVFLKRWPSNDGGMDVICCFDIFQFGFAAARLALGALVMNAMRGYKCSCSWYLDQGICEAPNCTSCSDSGQYNYHPRVCAALWIFYVMVVAKACFMVIKYVLVILVCDFGDMDQRVKSLTSILVHQQHGFFLTRSDMDTIESSAAEGKVSL